MLPFERDHYGLPIFALLNELRASVINEVICQVVEYDWNLTCIITKRKKSEPGEGSGESLRSERELES